MSENVLAPKRIVSIQDLSCFGRSALTVVIPSLSAMGYQVLPLPTALLSTHTGGFCDFHMRDLDADMNDILSHWASFDLEVDALYSGFLGSAAQADTVLRAITQFGAQTKRPLVLVDPAVADHGALYQTVSPETVDAMRVLCAHADVITPNLTEALFLCGQNYREVTRAELPALLRALCALGAKSAVVTGILFADTDTVGTATLDVDGVFTLFEQPHVGRAYPGTGDIFASVLLGKLLGGDSLADAAAFASAFIARVITDTAQADTPVRDGVLLERNLRYLIPTEESESKELSSK